MTAKQKANAQRFKKAVAEAKKIRAKNPKLTQPQAVKQAWAILYKTGKVAGTKKPVKKSTAKSYHKDTKSHNVRISVVSGIGKAGDYAKFEIATIKALAKLLKKSIKATQILVNNDQTILNIISNSFDKKILLGNWGSDVFEFCLYVITPFVGQLAPIPSVKQKRSTGNPKPLTLMAVWVVVPYL